MGNLTTGPNKYADFKAVSDQARAELAAETQLGEFVDDLQAAARTPPPDPAPAPPAPPALPTWLGPVALGLGLLLAIRSK